MINFLLIENMQKITQKTKAFILISLLVVVAFFYFHKNPVQKQIAHSITTTGFACIGKTGQDRLAEIIAGVDDESIPITDNVKKEFQGIFTKCNISEDDKVWYSVFGPEIINNYERLFFIDVLASFEAGVTVKSRNRQSFEDMALGNGTMSKEDFQKYSLELEQIIKGEPVGATQIIFTKQMITNLLDDTRAGLARVETLYW